MMSIVRRGQRKEFMMMYLLLTVVYLIGVVVELASTGLYQISLEGISIDNFTRFYT